MSQEVSYDVSVVLALNKIDQYTFISVDSIINQKDIDHEIILVANGEKANAIYDSLYTKYHYLGNIKILTTSIPQLVFSLNLGVNEARSNYIARMDADDIAMPDRLSKQLSYMLANDLDILGTDVFLIDKDGVITGNRIYPKSKEVINYKLLYTSPFCHPSVMYTKELFYRARGYSGGFNSEDYDLWLRSRRFQPNWDNFPEKLLMYRIHSSASQGSALAYSEVCGYFLREFLLAPSFILFFGLSVSVLKNIYIKFTRLF